MSMRRQFAGALVALVALATTVIASPAPASATPMLPVSAALVAAAKKGPARVIVGIKPGANASTLLPATLRAAATPIRTIATPTPMAVLSVNRPGLAALRKNANVLWIRQDHKSTTVLASSTHVIGADKAHAAGFTGANQSVAIIDTGVDTTHPFLQGRIVAEACFSHPTAPNEVSLCPGGGTDQTGAGSSDVKTGNCVAATNLCRHGTHVAGIAAGKKVPGAPADGVAPGANIVSVQVFVRGNDTTACPGGAPCIYTWDSDQLAALAFVQTQVATQHVAAANLSIGDGSEYASPCDTFDDPPNPPIPNPFKGAVDLLRASGAATVFAAGNDSHANGVNYPGCVSSGVTVGATNDSDALAPFTNRGSVLDFFAPGVDVVSSVPGGGYESLQGTSMSAPHVTGAFAVMKAAYPGRSIDFIQAKLRDEGKPIAFGSLTRPRIDLFESLPPVPTPTPTPTASPTPTATHTPSDKVQDNVYTGDARLPETVTTESQCARGHAKHARTVAQWAAIAKAGATSKTLACYLKIAGKASKVFDEKVDAATAAKAYSVLGSKSKVDGQVLAAWLNYAAGAVNLSSKVTKTMTFARAVKVVETDRLNPKTAPAKLAKDAAFLAKHVNG